MTILSDHPAVPAAAEPVVRVVDGELDSDLLAALTAVLFARAATRASESAAPPRRPLARWRRPERTAGYLSPLSWR